MSNYSEWTFDDLVSQVNALYVRMPKANRSKGRTKFVLEIGAILHEIKGRLQGEWVSQRRKIFPFSGMTAWRYCAVFEGVKDNPELYRECREKGTAFIYRKLELNYNTQEKNCDRTDFIVPTMNKEELQNFYIAYLILSGRDNLSIQKTIKNVWEKKDYSMKVKNIRNFIKNKKEIDDSIKKAVLYAIETYNYER